MTGKKKRERQRRKEEGKRTEGVKQGNKSSSLILRVERENGNVVDDDGVLWKRGVNPAETANGREGTDEFRSKGDVVGGSERSSVLAKIREAEPRHSSQRPWDLHVPPVDAQRLRLSNLLPTLSHNPPQRLLKLRIVLPLDEPPPRPSPPSLPRLDAAEVSGLGGVGCGREGVLRAGDEAVVDWGGEVDWRRAVGESGEEGGEGLALDALLV